MEIQRLIGRSLRAIADLTALGERTIAIDCDVIEAEANYAVFRTKLSQETTVFNVGRYLDRVRVTALGLKFESRLCIYDTEMIPNSLIYPI